MEVNSSTNKHIIIITWDGVSTPLAYLHQDGIPDFDILLFNYSGKQSTQKIPDNCLYLSKSTENKGQIFEAGYHFLQEFSHTYLYIGILDDDLLCTVQDLNKLLFIAQLEELDVFQPSITQDSYFDHRQFVHKSGVVCQAVDWVEIMAPFYKMAIFNAAYPFFKHTISGQGIDVYIIPTLQRLFQLPKTAVVHAVQIKHCRPIRSHQRIYSNGKYNLQEIATIQQLCKKLVAENDPTLFDTYFIKHILNKKYSNKITIYAKLLRVKKMFKNLYQKIVDASYR